MLYKFYLLKEKKINMHIWTKFKINKDDKFISFNSLISTQNSAIYNLKCRET